MNNYETLFSRIKAFAQEEERIKSMVLFGSRARKQKGSDAYSDYDLIFFVNNVEYFIKTDEWLRGIAEYSISFVEPTAVQNYERRVFFEDAMDMDFIFYDVKDIEKLTKHKVIQSWYSRGYEVVVDKIGYQAMIEETMPAKEAVKKITESEFVNLVHTFWFHAVWSEKKLLRGEIWAAKNCIDGYMKSLLREMLEHWVKTQCGQGFDIWHDGRFIDEWLEPEVKDALNRSYGTYNRESLEEALKHTMDLFSVKALQAAEGLGYAYPLGAEQYAFKQVKRLMNGEV